MSVFSFALALLVPLAGSLTSGEVAGSLVLAPPAKTDVEQTPSANASTSGNARSFLVINSPGEFFEWAIGSSSNAATAAYAPECEPTFQAHNKYLGQNKS
jgi:hypothetical protein